MIEVRREIPSILSQIFGVEVSVSDRARESFKKALSATNPVSADLLWAVTKTSPAISSVLSQAGYDVERLRKPGEAFADVRERGTSIESTLRSVFIRHDNDSLTDSAKKVVERRVVTELDILLSIAENGTYQARTLASHSFWAALKDEEKFLHEVGMSHQELDWTGGQRRFLASIGRHVHKHLAEIPFLAPDHADQQLAFVWDGAKVRVVPIGFFSMCHRPDAMREESFFGLRTYAANESSSFGQSVIDELEYLINSDPKEAEFQHFFETHPECLTTMEYKSLHPHLVLHEDDDRSKIPDFFAQKIESNFADIIDLKRAGARLSRRKTNRDGLSAALHEAVDQLRNYRNWFDDSRNREAFRTHYAGLDVFKPRVIVVMGRDKSFTSHEERIALEDTLERHVKLWTYDDVLARARSFHKYISQK